MHSSDWLWCNDVTKGIPQKGRFPSTAAPSDINKMDEELEQLFEKAANHLKSLVGKLETHQLLYFYADLLYISFFLFVFPSPSFKSWDTSNNKNTTHMTPTWTTQADIHALIYTNRAIAHLATKPDKNINIYIHMFRDL